MAPEMQAMLNDSLSILMLRQRASAPPMLPAVYIEVQLICAYYSKAFHFAKLTITGILMIVMRPKTKRKTLMREK